jgi:hypothetical protein
MPRKRKMIDSEQLLIAFSPLLIVVSEAGDTFSAT